MNDLISRKEAIDFIDAGHLCDPNEPRWSDNEIVNFLKSRPSAQPERKVGRWINYKDEHCCSVCDWVIIEDCWDEENRYDYCPYCGAIMVEGEEDENNLR